MSGPSVKDLAQVTDAVARRFGGMIRRMVVSVTTKPIWKLLGVRGLDGDEVVDAEAFMGFGFYARPPTSGGKPEVIVVNVGDARVPVVVAGRDEKTLAAVRDELGAGLPAAGDTLVFAANGAAVVYVKADGTVEIKTPGGTAAALATKADLDALRDWVAKQMAPVGGHTHASLGAPPTLGAGTSTSFTGAPPTAAGTSVLKGE